MSAAAAKKKKKKKLFQPKSFFFLGWNLQQVGGVDRRELDQRRLAVDARHELAARHFHRQVGERQRPVRSRGKPKSLRPVVFIGRTESLLPVIFIDKLESLRPFVFIGRPDSSRPVMVMFREAPFGSRRSPLRPAGRRRPVFFFDFFFRFQFRFE